MKTQHLKFYFISTTLSFFLLVAASSCSSDDESDSKDIVGNVTTMMNNTGTKLYFNEISGFCFTNQGDILFTQSGNSKIKKISPTGEIIHFAGGFQGVSNGPIASALFFPLTI